MHGQIGSGKSTLISHIGKEQSQSGVDVVPIFCGYTNLTSNGFDILQYITYEMERRLGITDHYYEKKSEKVQKKEAWHDYIHRLFEYYSEAEAAKLLFLIDGIDQLSQDEIAENCTFIPDRHFSNIQFVVSTVTTDRMPLDNQIEITDLNESERKHVVLGILKGRHRELSDTVIRQITLLPNSRLPLYLSLIIQRLIMMNYEDFQKIAEIGEDMNAITKYQLMLIDECPNTLDDLSVYIMGRASNQIGGEPVKLMGFFLALSRRGLRYSDLEMLVNALKNQDGQCCKLSMVDTARYLQYLGDFFFTRSDGRIDFTHKCFRQGLQQVISDKLPLHNLIASWLDYLPKDDEVRSQELSWHLIQGNSIAALANLEAQEADNKALCDNMAKDLAELVSRDGGKWLLCGLYKIADEPVFPTFSGFVREYVVFQLPDTKKGLDLRKALVLTVLKIEEGSAKNEAHANQWDISVSYERLSSIEREYDLAEHDKKAIIYAKKCLEIRKTLLEKLQNIKNEQAQMAFLLEQTTESGLRLTKLPTPHLVESVMQGFYIEYSRGIGVANYLVAEALRSGYPDTAREALTYLEEILYVRNILIQQMNNSEETYTPMFSDETYELAILHQKIAEAYEFLENDDSLKKAENHLLQSIRICEKTVLNDPSNDHIIILSQSYRLMAAFISDHQINSWNQAVGLAKKSLNLMEPLYRKTRTASEQYELSLVYELIGNLYSQKQDEESTALAHECYARMNSLAKGLLFKTDWSAGKKAAITAGIKEALTAGSLSPEEMKEYFSITYNQAKELFDSFLNYESYQRLEEVYIALIHVIEQSRFGKEPVGKRASIEVRYACLDRVIEINDVPLKMLKHRVVEYNELSEKIQELTLPDDAVWPQEWMDLLNCINISIDILKTMPARRAYEMSKKGCELAKKICKLEDTIINRDALAVSLSKLASICMQVDLQEFSIVNKELMDLAIELSNKTGNKKYAMMIFQAQMGSHLVNGSISEFMDRWFPQSKNNKGAKKENIEKIEKESISEKDIRDSVRAIKRNENIMKKEIEITIQTYDEMGVLPSEIENEIMNRFNLSKQEAEDYVKKTLNPKLT